MKYAYEDLGDDQFEKLVVFLCQRLLGMGVQSFAKGPDGGRDAKFVGTAERHPSVAAPWKGITIIQAKHTNGYNKNFSEPDFYSKKSDETILGYEIPRVRKMREQNQIDHYMLFSNRRLAANAEAEIVAYISNPCGIPTASIYLCGLEQLEIWLKNFPEVPKLANLDLVDSPLIVSPDDLSEVVQAFARQRDTIKDVLDDPPTARVSYEQKNAINNMTEDYAVALRKRYLKETRQIRAFLAAPENIALLRLYESVADEFQLKIIANRKKDQTFDKVLEYLIDLLFKRDPILRQHKKLTRCVLFYMYWNCDLGDTGDVATN
jgi:hypothetical protein